MDRRFASDWDLATFRAIVDYSNQRLRVSREVNKNQEVVEEAVVLV